jgi:ABC-type amino acid transport substrate-binding protein
VNRILQILGVILLLAVGACDGGEKKTLVVGTAADYPPFSFVSGKQVVGFDIDLAKEIADRLGYRLHIKEMRFNDLMPALKKNNIDLCISAMTATLERAKEVDFSVKYYLPSFALMYKKLSPIASMKDLEGKTIAVPKGSTMEGFLKENLGGIKNVKVVSFDRTSAMLEDLRKGRTDCILIEAAQSKAFCAMDGAFAYSDVVAPGQYTNYAIAFPKGSELRSKVDKILIRLKVSNRFDQLRKKWFQDAAVANTMK